MKKRLLKIATTTLAVLVAFGCVINTAAAIEGCMPKACCCKKMAMSITRSAHGNGATNCNGAAPCCQVQPSIPFPDMAIVASPEAPVLNPATATGIFLHYGISAQQDSLIACPYMEIHLKIPLTPLYLQNQSFLC